MSQATAAPVKCVVDGKTLYTDDAARCGNGSVAPIKGNILIGSAAKPALPNKPDALPGVAFPSMLNGILQQFGLTEKDVAEGWKTVQEARERGTWQEPPLPEEAK